MNLKQELGYGGKSFDAWMAKVDNYLEAKYGLASDDLDDWAYADDFAAGGSAIEAAKAAVRYSGGY